VANFNTFSISLDHSFQTLSGITLGNSVPQGYLKSPSKSVTSGDLSYKDTLVEFHSLASDILSMPLFLDAAVPGSASFDLDAIANDYLNTNNDPNFVRLSYRQFGLVILLIVNYNNIDNYWEGCNERHQKACYVYNYELAPITSIQDFVEETIYTAYPYNRTTIENRGIRIVGVLTGQIGSFDFQALLLQLTTSLTLIKLATVIVDQIAMYILPKKSLYKAAKYERTEDFSDIADAEKRKEIELN